MSEVLKMSDRDKKIEEELRLSLLEITEDPTFQGCYHNDAKRICGAMIDLKVEEQRETGKRSIRTIH
jgi:hypothetical protein